MLRLFTACAAFAVAAALATAADDDKDFKPLFNGKDLTGWKIQGDNKDTYKVADGAVQVSGKPNGYFYTDKSYKNYHLKFDVKYAKPKGLADDATFGGNSGILVHITGDHKVWPKSVEVQGQNKELGKIFAIGGAKGEFKNDVPAIAGARKPVGEWNAVEIISQDGKLTSILNGKKIGEGTSELKEGPIGFQSEGAEIHFKNLRIKEAK